MICVTAAFPFVPAELNIAHAASTYVPADVYYRLLKVTGHDAMLISATDYHSIYASKDGIHTDIALCEMYHQKYLEYFEKLNIHFEHYIKTNDMTHENKVINVFSKLMSGGKIYLEDTEDSVCEQCGCCLPKRMATVDGITTCAFCHSDKIITKVQPHYHLRLSQRKEKVIQLARIQKQAAVQNMILKFTEKDFKDWDISRYNKLGVEIPGNSEQSFYIWFDSLVAYLSLMEKENKPIEKMVHFLGKNIVYYHSVIWPYIYEEVSNDNAEIYISARGFLDMEKTDDGLESVENLCAEYDSDFIRFYLSFKVKDNISDYSFSKKDFEEVVQFYCCKKIGGFFFRIWNCLKKSEDSIKSESIETHTNLLEREKAWEQFKEELLIMIENQNVHEALRLIIQYMDDVSLWSKKLELVAYKDKAINSYLRRESARIICLLATYMPELAKKYSVFTQWVPASLMEAEECEKHCLKEEKEIVKI